MSVCFYYIDERNGSVFIRTLLTLTLAERTMLIDMQKRQHEIRPLQLHINLSSTTPNATIMRCYYIFPFLWLFFSETIGVDSSRIIIWSELNVGSTDCYLKSCVILISTRVCTNSELFKLHLILEEKERQIETEHDNCAIKKKQK